MNKPTHLTKLFVSLSTAMFLLTGCATAQKEVTVPKPKKNINVYIDNTNDEERQKNIVETYVWAINNTDAFRVEKNNQPSISPLQFQRQLVKGTTGIYCDIGAKESQLLPNINFVTYNYEYPNALMDETRIKVKYQDKNFYNKKYSAKVLYEDSFEITGFDSKIEAMDIYVELMRSTTQLYKNNFVGTKLLSSDKYTLNLEPNKFILALQTAPKPINALFSRDYWDFSLFYHGRGFVYDPNVLENENRLVITPIIKLYSLKNHLTTLLSMKGYSVVEEAQKAQIIINVENLYYGTERNFKSVAQPLIEQYIKDPTYKSKQYNPQNLTKETQALTDQASTASSLGNTDLAKGIAEVAAANLVLGFLGGDDNDNGYFISYVNIKMNGKEIFKSPNYVKITNKANIQSQILCKPELQAFKSSQMIIKTLEEKLAE